MDLDLKTSAFLPDMSRSAFLRPPNAALSSSSGITILEVLVAVSIAGGAIALLVPALMRQLALGEQSNRLTAVEAVVSSDLNWFSTYARVWKLKSGSCPVAAASAVTKTTSPCITAGAATFEPPEAECKQAADSASGLAKKLLDDGADLRTNSSASTLNTYYPPNPLTSPTTIPVTSGRVSGLNVIRTVTPVGNRIRLLYRLDFANDASRADLRNNGLNFSREASVFVEASAWCDRIP